MFNTFRSRWATAALSVVMLAMTVPSYAATAENSIDHPKGRPEVVEMGDSRLKFEVNATDGDAGIQTFIDADSWRTMSIYDPDGRQIFRATTKGRMAQQGGTELFLESAEPSFSELPLDQLLDRWPEGEYRFRGRALDGTRYVGSAQLTHNLPQGPVLIAPIDGSPAQDPSETVVAWQAVDPPNGSPIIGYQVIIVDPDTGLVGLPKITLDVMMPPDATEMLVPPGFLQPDTEYEWEVLAIETGGNQTLSSSSFVTSGG